jgi:adenosylcobalamin-dependent ribonucleoside-triphosphate reductase
MGTDFVENRSAAGLFNCGFITTKELASRGGYIYQWMMDALMLGIGVGFDTAGAGTILIKNPGSVTIPSNYYTERVGFDGLALTITPYSGDQTVITIHDSREGWVQSVRVLLDSFFYGYEPVIFDYSLIREAGQPIKGFGGISSGPEPLVKLHAELIALYTQRINEVITSVDIVDTENFIGKCVVSGNVRRSAAVSLGDQNDFPYLTMKNDQEALRDRRWGSNNSVFATVGMDYSWYAEQSQINGEPGYVWLENARTHGRFKDGLDNSDVRISGFNPCIEIGLESEELCNVPETFPAHHDTLEDYLATLKIAYLYGKTVTLTRTHWKGTNAVMQKNRRIGLSQSGVVQAFNKHGTREMFRWCDEGYSYIDKLDAIYSDWLCVPRSKRKTANKPSGTVSLVAGATPGVHDPEDEYYLRRIRFSDTSDLLPAIRAAGYDVVPCLYSPNTVVVSFPVHEPYFKRGKREVSMWEQLERAALYQYYWADNAVSVTVTFKEHEANQIKHALELYEGRLKAVSFLRYQETGYEQAPYEPITETQYHEAIQNIQPIQYSKTDEAGEGTSFCDGACTLPWLKSISSSV